MIRAKSIQANGRVLLLLGVDRENITRLTAGQPIFVDGDKHGLDLDFDVGVLFGETLQDVINELGEAGVQFPKGDG